MPHRTDSPAGEVFFVEAYSRLHFGLLEIHPQAPHCFGGIGLMVDKPSVRLLAKSTGTSSTASAIPESHQPPSMHWKDAYWKDRFERVYANFRNRTQVTISGSIELDLAPSPHVGLGSGTQFACAASAILNAQRNPLRPVSDRMDATWTIDSGRGLRSHIGLHGFLSGQMVVDQGIEPAGTLESSRRTLVEPFPENWRVVLIYEDVYQGDFGENEQSIFDACSKRQNPHRERMLELIDRQILPSVRIEDFQGACQAIGHYGELAGGVFAEALGDVYRSPRIRYWVDRLRFMGFAGTGQSSWGPVVFVLTQDQQQAQWLIERIAPDLLEGGWASITKVAGPARIENLP